MNRIFLRQILLIFLLVAPMHTLCYAASQKNAKDIVAVVLGKSLQRDQFDTSTPDNLQYDLQELVITPLFRHYYEQHKKEMDATSLEITDFLLYSKKQHEKEIASKKQGILDRIKKITDILGEEEKNSKGYDQDLLAELYYLKAELDPPGYDYAMFIVPFWKIQVYLYKTFGKGRILLQDRGYEAFDAMLNWLLDQEKKGNFAIHDPDLHKQLYSYWKDVDHGSNVIGDKKIIEKQFLHPPWLE